MSSAPASTPLPRMLYVAPRYDYGDRARGESFTHHNFFDTFASMGCEVLYVDSRTLEQDYGRERFNALLLDAARTGGCTAGFFCINEDEISPATLTGVRDALPTVNWFTDDHWRFERYSSKWAHLFTRVATTDAQAIPKYHALGLTGTVKTQWAVNPYLYRRLDTPKRYDVTFIGQPYGVRNELIAHLQRSGISVECFGHGWPNGRVSQERMIEIFSQSRINLNFATAAMTPKVPRPKGVALLKRRIARWAGPLRGPLGISGWIPSAPPPPKQVKGRNFELPGCGAFTLTEPFDQLGEYFTGGEHLALFDGPDQLLSQVQKYLADEPLRERIADAGHAHCLAHHTYVHRFCELLTALSVPCPAANDLLASPRPRGSVTYVQP
jgi:spore maturation protein CgeB